MREAALKSIFALLLIVAGQQSHRAQQPPAAGQSFEAVATQAAQARETNRIEEAIKLYRQALTLRPGWGEGWFHLGALHYDKDVYGEAAQAFRRSTDYSPQVGTAWAMLGLSELKLGRYDEALKHIRRARRLGIAADANLNRVVTYNEALLLLNIRDFERAQVTLGKLSGDGVVDQDLMISLGLSVLRIRPSESHALDQTTRQAIFRAGQAEHLAAQKKLAEATTEYERLAADFPKTPNVHLARGRFLRSNGETEKAIAPLRREIENDSGHWLARLLIADSMLALKDYAGGIPYAEEAIKLRPRLPLGHFLLGSLLLGAGEIPRAIKELEAARAIEPNDSRIHYALGSAYARANRKEDAARARAEFVRLSKEEEAAANQ